MKYFNILLTVTFLMSWGCASIYQLDSRPSGATVFSGTNQIGTTPLELSLDQVTEKLGEGGLIRLEIVGHYPLTVWLPNSKQRINATINLNPLKLANRKSSSKTMVNVSRKKINALTDQMLDFQSKLLKGEKIPSADLVKIVNSNPSLGSAYFLAAMAFLAEKNENEGKNYASKASRLSPLESDFHILLQSQEPKTNAAGNQ